MIHVKDYAWAKLKRYPHIGRPLSQKEFSVWVYEYITDQKKIASHSFLPLIHTKKIDRRFRKCYSEEDGELLVEQNKGQRVLSKKPRDIYYASHLDSLVFSYYTFLINDKYEKELGVKELGDNVTGYRSLPKIADSEGTKKCNIDFAFESFQFIENFPDSEFSVLALDIEGFFDNLDHAKIMETWLGLLGLPSNEKLPKDHFNLFKSITRYSFVEFEALFSKFKEQIVVNDSDKLDKDFDKKNKIDKSRFLFEQNAISFCSKIDFFKYGKDLIKVNKYLSEEGKPLEIRKKGIPQGLPISSVMANAYMLNFDYSLKTKVESLGGHYRRYSDDIIIVILYSSKHEILSLAKSEIAKAKLNIKDSKTQKFIFRREIDGSLKCGQEFIQKVNWNKNLNYLGFSFDGKSILLKSSSLSKYQRKMQKAVRRGRFFAKQPSNKFNGELFRRRLYQRYSYQGAKRRRIWKYDERKGEHVKTNRYDWGNFLTYGIKASTVMGNPKIKRQLKRSWKQLNYHMKKK